MHINTAMFEQNAHCGYVLKPSSFREKTSVPFNPFGRDFDGLKPTTLTIHVSKSLYSAVNMAEFLSFCHSVVFIHDSVCNNIVKVNCSGAR